MNTLIATSRMFQMSRIRALYQNAAAPKGSTMWEMEGEWNLWSLKWLSSRRSFLVAVAAGAVLAGGPTSSHAAVTDATRAAIAKLQAEDPSFKLTRLEKRCLDGTETDAGCEEVLVGKIKVRESEIRLSQTEARLSQTEARLVQEELRESAIFHLDITIALIELVNYVEFDQPLPTWGGAMKRVLDNKNTPQDIRLVLVDFRKRKESGNGEFTPVDGRNILGLMRTHLDAGIALKEKLVKTKYYEPMGQNVAMANQAYQNIQRAMAKKMS